MTGRACSRILARAALAALLASLALSSRAQAPAGRLLTPEVRRAMEEVRAAGIRAHVRYLSDDLLEGRDTSTPGGLLAARYLAAQLEQMGVAPAGDGGTYFQQVPFVRARADGSRSRLTLSGGDAAARLEFGSDFLLNGMVPGSVRLDAPMLFAGYGIRAPEFRHDDYRGLDPRGKLVVVLSGEPPSNDPAFFSGDKDTPHADGGSKLLLARSLGARGLVTVLVGPRARRFPWDGMRASQERPRLVLPPANADAFPALVVRDAGAEKLFAGAASSWEDVRAMAEQGRAPGFPLPRAARLELAAESAPEPGPNVVAMLPGSHPELRKQVVVYTAHYDHLGRRQGEGDTIYNGAWDNASGTAGVLEVARAFAALARRPARSILFLFVTGEERGLLGSRYYTRAPAVPIERTAANINLDMTDIFGVPREFVPLGAEHSTLQAACEEVARETGWKIGRDPVPQLNVFARSDHFSFVRAGVPSLFLQWASDYEDVDAAAAKARAEEKLRTIYHRVADEFDPSWSWEGMRRHSQAAFLIGVQVAGRNEMPSWKEGSAYARARAPVED